MRKVLILRVDGCQPMRKLDRYSKLISKQLRRGVVVIDDDFCVEAIATKESVGIREETYDRN